MSSSSTVTRWRCSAWLSWIFCSIRISPTTAPSWRASSSRLELGRDLGVDPLHDRADRCAGSPPRCWRGSSIMLPAAARGAGCGCVASRQGADRLRAGAGSASAAGVGAACGVRLVGGSMSASSSLGGGGAGAGVSRSGAACERGGTGGRSRSPRRSCSALTRALRPSSLSREPEHPASLEPAAPSRPWLCTSRAGDARGEPPHLGRGLARRHRPPAAPCR